MSAALAVICAFAIDVRLGEPRARWHPVVWIGRALGSCGAPWADVAPRTAFRRGVMVWLALALASAGAGAAVTAAVLAITGRMTTAGREVLQALLLGVSLKPLLAWQLLHDEVAAVDVALETSLDAGRSRLRRLCSRDASALSATQVRESALESLAENLNDSVVAPLFWFVLGGLPAAALYRFANTADAMWGYRGRFEWAGKCSARADDLLSYVPARITALLLALAAPCWPRGLRREAGRTPSPNGGWPMAMLALALDVQLTKPGVYVLHEGGRPAAAADHQRGLQLATRAAVMAVAAAFLTLLLLAAATDS